MYILRDILCWKSGWKVECRKHRPIGLCIYGPQVYTYICKYNYIYIYIYIYIWPTGVYLHLHMYLYIYIYIRIFAYLQDKTCLRDSIHAHCFLFEMWIEFAGNFLHLKIRAIHRVRSYPQQFARRIACWSTMTLFLNLMRHTLKVHCRYIAHEEHIQIYPIL